MTDREKLVELIKLIDEHYQISYHRQAGEIVGILNTDELAADLIAHGVTVQENLVAKQVVIDKKYGSPRCPSCNAVLGASSHYCWQCGQKVTHKWTVKQMQKPLTVDEAFNSRWSEPNLWIELREKETLFLMNGDTFTNESYGKTWRCWAEKPTEEEREAAKWEK